MASVGLFFGSDTGNTEHIAKMIQKELGKSQIDLDPDRIRDFHDFLYPFWSGLVRVGNF